MGESVGSPVWSAPTAPTSPIARAPRASSSAAGRSPGSSLTGAADAEILLASELYLTPRAASPPTAESSSTPPKRNPTTRAPRARSPASRRTSTFCRSTLHPESGAPARRSVRPPSARRRPLARWPLARLCLSTKAACLDRLRPPLSGGRRAVADLALRSVSSRAGAPTPAAPLLPLRRGSLSGRDRHASTASPPANPKRLFDRVATGALVSSYAPAADGRRFFTFREPQATGAGVAVALDLGFARRVRPELRPPPPSCCASRPCAP